MIWAVELADEVGHLGKLKETFIFPIKKLPVW
jgi:hypothetical protein